MTSKKQGFTLIELLVVIAIIGILSSVVLASLNTAREKSRDARRVSDMKQFQLALELYFDSQTPASYPVQAEGGLPDLVTPGFIAVTPTEPVAGRQSYLYLGTVTSYCVGVDLEGTPPAVNDTCATNLADLDINFQVGP